MSILMRSIKDSLVWSTTFIFISRTEDMAIFSNSSRECMISTDFKGASHGTMDALTRIMLRTAGEKMTTKIKLSNVTLLFCYYASRMVQRHVQRPLNKRSVSNLYPHGASMSMHCPQRIFLHLQQLSKISHPLLWSTSTCYINISSI